MPELLSRKTVRARKAHVCSSCNAWAVQPGEEYERSTYVFDGHVYDWVQCAGCVAITSAVIHWLDGYRDDGIGADAYAEWAQEHADHTEHGEAARAYLSRLGPRAA